MLSFSPFATLPIAAALAIGVAAPANAQPAATAVPAPAKPAEVALEAGEGRKVAALLATQLESDFVIPAHARDYAAILRKNAAAGRYDKGTRGALAALLTGDLQAVHKDGHLRIRATAPEDRGGRPPSMGAPLIQAAKTIAPGIGYIRFTAFFGQAEEMDAIRAWLAANAGATTLIFDLRNHHGGGLDEQDLIFAQLYKERLPLVRMEMAKAIYDQHGAPTGDNPNLKFVADGARVEAIHYSAPDAASTLNDATVYVLTSNRTASAAEHFSLALKSTGRATLIGEATAGANHFGGPGEITDHFDVWMPVGRTSDVRTGKDWEGAGVAPDIVVDPKDALVVALEKAGLSRAEAVRLDAGEVPSEPIHNPKLVR